jgi:hypothetical protein
LSPKGYGNTITLKDKGHLKKKFWQTAHTLSYVSQHRIINKKTNNTTKLHVLNICDSEQYHKVGNNIYIKHVNTTLQLAAE